MKELIATIHFIGLALFSTQVPDTRGLQVLFPRVESHQHATSIAPEEIDATPTEPTDTTEPTVTPEPTSTIEPHEVYVIYDKADFLSEIGFASQNLPAHMVREGTTYPPQYRFVRVSGERVAFSASSASPSTDRATLPLPRPKCSESIASTNAEATVGIPRGTLTACGARFATERRYDTKLQVTNPKELVITAAAGSVIKALTLKGNATVYIANIPAAILTSEDWQASGAEHFHAYYELLGTSCAEEGLTAPSSTLSTCDAKPLWLTGEGPAKVSTDTVAIAQVVDSACSNSAWP